MNSGVSTGPWFTHQSALLYEGALDRHFLHSVWGTESQS
jgi:hypothetical protein